MRIFIVSSKDKMLKDMSTRSQNKYVLFLLFENESFHSSFILSYRECKDRESRSGIKRSFSKVNMDKWKVCGIKMIIDQATFDLFYSTFCVASPSGLSLGMSCFAELIALSCKKGSPQLERASVTA